VRINIPRILRITLQMIYGRESWGLVLEFFVLVLDYSHSAWPLAHELNHHEPFTIWGYVVIRGSIFILVFGNISESLVKRISPFPRLERNTRVPSCEILGICLYQLLFSLKCLITSLLRVNLCPDDLLNTLPGPHRGFPEVEWSVRRPQPAYAL